MQVPCDGQAPTAAASPFVRLPSRSPFQSGSPVVEARPVPTAGAVSGSGGVTLEAGPVHYSTVEMSMVNEGRFEHIGRATIRVEGASCLGGLAPS